MTRLILAAALSAGLAAPVLADGHVTMRPFDGSFEDAAFAVESAIIGQGLVIDYVSHVGEMLTRTGADVGSEVALFDEADIFLFCSAVVSRQVMEADPMNIAHCPYGIFVTDMGGEVSVGFRTMPEGPMSAVQDLLTGIVEEAVSQ